MSAVLDADGGLVCGSLICEQPPEMIQIHKQMVEAVNNQPSGLAYDALSWEIRQAPKSWLPALVLVVLEAASKQHVFASREATNRVIERQLDKYWKD
jgi:hypothetical protein